MSTEKEMSKRQLYRMKMRQKKMRSRIITVLLVVIGSVLFAYVLIQSSYKPTADIVTAEPGTYPQANKNSMGDPDAPVKLEEYSDYQCPYCRDFSTLIMPQIVETYIATGKVYFTYHSFGNWISRAGNNTESEDAARAAYCAGDQNKFWEMHSNLFANWRGENAGSYTDQRLVSIAEASLLDMDQFNKCYDSNKYADQVMQDFANGTAEGIKGTPTFVLSYIDAGGQTIKKLVQNSLVFDNFQQEIDAALAAAGK